jgi:hypothetical protein
MTELAVMAFIPTVSLTLGFLGGIFGGVACVLFTKKESPVIFGAVGGTLAMLPMIATLFSGVGVAETLI